MRAILHSDLNSYYANVEILLNPELRGKAVAVCGNTEERRGIVLAKSALAKKYGVKTGMVNWEAKIACPELILVPPQYEQYIKFSSLVREIYSRYTDMIEPFGMDECWLDVTNSKTHGTAMEIAENIRKTCKRELGLTVSIGVSYNKIFAKLGSDMKKPDAITQITRENYKSKVWPLAADELMGIGPATKRKLFALGVKTIGDLACCDSEVLKSWLGINGVKLWEYANGRDYSRVAPAGYVAPAKTVGHGITCNADLNCRQDVKKVLLSLSPGVSYQLRKIGMKACGVSLTLRDNELHFHEYQTKLPYPTQSWHELTDEAMQLLINRYKWEKPVRAVTIRAINLISEKLPQQSDIFENQILREKTETLERTIDDIQRRFGEQSIKIAATMTAKAKRNAAMEKLTMPSVMYT
ncbi:MAG: DNA polymerase IV [Ruminococcaceae bacterium]|nr:DNA polymerase IV [Oscillospiraceae bacterium]